MYSPSEKLDSILVNYTARQNETDLNYQEKEVVCEDISRMLITFVNCTEELPRIVFF